MAKKIETAVVESPARKRVRPDAPVAPVVPTTHASVTHAIEKHISGTAAAVKVFKRRKNKEMTAGDLTSACKEVGWAPGGKTPKQTLVAAIQNEIKRKGERSRFTKGGTPGTWRLSEAAAS